MEQEMNDYQKLCLEFSDESIPSLDVATRASEVFTENERRRTLLAALKFSGEERKAWFKEEALTTHFEKYKQSLLLATTDTGVPMSVCAGLLSLITDEEARTLEAMLFDVPGPEQAERLRQGLRTVSTEHIDSLLYEDEPLLREELVRLNAAKNAREWDDTCDTIKYVRNGRYPRDWAITVLASGFYGHMSRKFERAHAEETGTLQHSEG